jgi:FkbM family methyltransferase
MTLLSSRLTRTWRSWRGRRIWRRRMAPKLLAAFAERYPSACFVEIGSNDGHAHDHLRDLIKSGGWTGVMVEPVPEIFERLKRNYGGVEGLVLENAAIADRDGELPFHHLRQADPGEDRLPDWYQAVGSFKKEVVLSHADQIPDLEERLITVDVPTLTFDSLCRKHGIESIDLLLVDTEGYDYELLANVDLPAHHPRLLTYEHFHLDPADRRSCREYVEAAGYETVEEGFDTWCLDTAPTDALTKAWRRLSPALPGLSASDGST